MGTVFSLEVKTGKVMAAEYKGGILNFPGYVVFWKHAWTGGDAPPKRFDGKAFKQVRSLLFRELLTACGGGGAINEGGGNEGNDPVIPASGNGGGAN